MRPGSRIMLADDHLLFRELIKKNLQEIPGLEVVGEARDGLELIDRPKTCSRTPTWLFWILRCPGSRGSDPAKWLKKITRTVEILILTMHKSKYHLQAAINARIDGYLLKEDAFQDYLVTAIDTIRRGDMLSNLTTKTMVESLILRKFHNPKSPLSEQRKYRW